MCLQVFCPHTSSTWGLMMAKLYFTYESIDDAPSLNSDRFPRQPAPRLHLAYRIRVRVSPNSAHKLPAIYVILPSGWPPPGCKAFSFLPLLFRPRAKKVPPRREFPFLAAAAVVVAFSPPPPPPPPPFVWSVGRSVDSTSFHISCQLLPPPPPPPPLTRRVSGFRCRRHRAQIACSEGGTEREREREEKI